MFRLSSMRFLSISTRFRVGVGDGTGNVTLGTQNLNKPPLQHEVNSIKINFNQNKCLNILLK